MGTFN